MQIAPLKSSAPPEILHPQSRNLFRYWDSIRGEHRAASRNDLDLRQIHDLLPWLFVSEPDIATPAAHRFRLAGTGICRMWQENLTGKSLFAAWSNFERRTACSLLRGTIEDCQPFVMRVRARTENGAATTIEIMGLPVRAEAGNQNQVLGIIVPFRQPEWLGRERLTAFELSSVRVILTDRQPLAAPSGGTSSRRPMLQPVLKVIQGGKDD
jgi:hypothetical protein